ncbi:MAG: hypothetical protein ACQEQI_02315 [Bacillota bacterium]
MEIIVGVDDTDNLESLATGRLTLELIAELEEEGFAECERITRHQLLYSADVPYTSHNSSMAFRAEIREDNLNRLIDYGANFLTDRSAEGSDPGWAVIDLEALNTKESNKLISFGKDAQKEVLTKEAAYNLAAELGVHLSEHGGTGEGVIGALAGTGLRLTGNDGRFQGRLEIKSEDGLITVAKLKDYSEVDLVRSLGGKKLADKELIQLDERIKTVFLDYKSILLVKPTLEGGSQVAWKTCLPEDLRDY